MITVLALRGKKTMDNNQGQCVLLACFSHFTLLLAMMFVSCVWPVHGGTGCHLSATPHCWLTSPFFAEPATILEKSLKGGRGISDVSPVWNLRAASLIPLFYLYLLFCSAQSCFSFCHPFFVCFWAVLLTYFSLNLHFPKRCGSCIVFWAGRRWVF